MCPKNLDVLKTSNLLSLLEAVAGDHRFKIPLKCMKNVPFCVLVLIVPKSSGSVDIMLIYREYLSNYSDFAIARGGFFPSSVLFVSLKTNDTFARRPGPKPRGPRPGKRGVFPACVQRSARGFSRTPGVHPFASHREEKVSKEKSHST